MAQLKLFWTETAIRQRNFVFEYWIERNQNNSYSKKLKQKIQERTALLLKNSELGKKTDFKNTRQISLGHYSILYQKIELMIVITGFWDNRQDSIKLLEFLNKM